MPRDNSKWAKKNCRFIDSSDIFVQLQCLGVWDPLGYLGHAVQPWFTVCLANLWFIVKSVGFSM